MALPDYAELAQLWRRLISVQTAVNARDLLGLGVDLLADDGQDHIPLELRELIELGLTQSAYDHARDGIARTHVLDAINDRLSEFDIIATPTLGVDGVRNGERGRTVGPSTIAGRPTETTIGWTLTFPLNFSGHPAISIPVGLSRNGLPVGLQLIGRRGADRDLLRWSATIERALSEG